jgi:hypothetical protein
MTKERENELQQKSGSVSSTDPVAVLLYMLAKDYLPVQKLEELFEKLSAVLPGTVVFNNGWLGQYATELAGKVRSLSPKNLAGNLDNSVVTFPAPIYGPGACANDWGNINTDGQGKATCTTSVGGTITKIEYEVPVLKATNTVSVHGGMINILPHLEKKLGKEEVERIKQDIKEFEEEQNLDDLFRGLIQ